MSEYNNLEEGLLDLQKRIGSANPTWNDELKQMYFAKVDALEGLLLRAKDTSLESNAWMNLVQHINADPREFGVAEWMLSYKQLSESFNVPMSWINALSIRVVTDRAKLGWKVTGINLLDDDGYLWESAYSAWLDGVSSGMLPEPSEFERETMNNSRHPTMIARTNAVAEKFKEQCEFFDMDVDEAKEAMRFIYDCTLA